MARSGRDWFTHENAVHYRACHLPRGFWLLRPRVEKSPDHIYILSGQQFDLFVGIQIARMVCVSGGGYARRIGLQKRVNECAGK